MKLSRLIVAILVAFVMIGFVIPLIVIQFRLARNTPLAKELAAELQQTFPTAEFRGGAPYERDEIHISVERGLETIDREAVKTWLRVKRVEKRIGAKIWISFGDDKREPLDP